MGKKYIIELEDKPFHKGNGDFLYRVKGFNSLVFDMTGVGKLTPYTEPDLAQAREKAYIQGLKDGQVVAVANEQNNAFNDGYKKCLKDMEQVRKEAYEAEMNSNAVRIADDKAHEAYQKGLSDAWEAARKIASDNAGEKYSIFGQHFTEEILNTHSAAEALEEIRAHEQAQKEKEKEKSITTEDVMRQYLDAFCRGKICSECPLNAPNFTCGRGRYFLTSSPVSVSDEEVRMAYTTVLQKMKEE